MTVHKRMTIIEALEIACVERGLEMLIAAESQSLRTFDYVSWSL